MGARRDDCLIKLFMDSGLITLLLASELRTMEHLRTKALCELLLVGEL